jgi:hypothetical protein
MVQADPRNALALVQRANIYSDMIRTVFEAKYKQPSLIPAKLRARYLFLTQTWQANIDSAHALGWLDESEWPESEKRRIAALANGPNSSDAKPAASDRT